MSKIKEYVTVAVLIVISSLLMAIPVPIAMVLFASLTAALVGFSFTKFHYTYASFCVLLVFAVNLLITKNILLALTSSLPCILCGLSLGICYNLKFSTAKFLGITSGVYLVNTIANFALAKTNESGLSFLEEAIYSIGAIYKETLTSSGGVNVSESEVDALITELTSMLLRFMPAFIIIASICFALLGYFVFQKILIIAKSDISCFSRFSDWKADKPVSIMFLVLLVIGILSPQGAYISDVLANVVTASSFVFYVLGLSYIDFKAKAQTKRRRRLLLALIFLSTFAFMGIPYMVVSLLGALDGCFNLRHKNETKIN
ncbi:MAG: DUF2232 domain-containing protein [Clostridia bacterium]|nr:DUF2232 domain-containing protein [Clostridia bacterium]